MSALMLGQRSFDDLGTPLHDATFCVLDLETTGGNRSDDMITEIGVVKVRGGECLGTFHTLVNPGRAIPPQITVLTGLTDAVVYRAPRIETVLGSLMDFLGDAVFVAHNASFDLGFVRAALGPRRPCRVPPDRRRHRHARTSTPPRRGAELQAQHARDRACDSTTRPTTGRSTTRSPRPICSTSCSSGQRGWACSVSTTSCRWASSPGTRRPASSR